MASKSLLKQPMQKWIYAKESTLSSNGTNDSGIMGLFKSSSSLARSIRKQPDPAFQSSIKSSASLIMNPQGKPVQDQCVNTASLKPSVSSTSKDIKIRNIIHDYANIDVNENTYNTLHNLKLSKRGRNLDTLDEYEVWKTEYIETSEDNVKEKVSSLKSNWDSTQNEINSKFTMKNEDLIPWCQNDIDNIAKFYHGVIQNRDNNIGDTLKQVMGIFSECFATISLRIIALGKSLDGIGYHLEEEIKALTDDKAWYISNWTESKKNLYNRVILEIRDSEKQLIEESKKALVEFILRWKNIKLNHHIEEVKLFLSSPEITDNNERYTLIENIKRDQIKIYKDRYTLIFEKLFKLKYDEITTKSIDDVNKELEEIFSFADKTFTEHIKILVQNSDDIHNNSWQQIDLFKSKVELLSYEFGKDNWNEKKYNEYEDLKTIDELIDKVFSPIWNDNKSARTEYMSKVNSYIDDYEDYVHNVSNQMVMFYSKVGKYFDENKRNLHSADRNYWISWAKALDNDDELIFEKEEMFKKIIEEMRNCINKTELDENWKNSFNVMDEWEKEYREFFKIYDELLNGHDGIITNTFHDYETKLLKLFGYYDLIRVEEIINRRNIESNFLSKKKEAELAVEEQKKLDEEANMAEKGGKKAKPVKKQEKKAPLKKGEVSPALIPPRDILDFKSKLEFDYKQDFTIEEYVRHLLRNIVYGKDDDIFELKKPDPTKEDIERMLKEKEEREKEEQELKDNKGKKPPSRVGDRKAGKESGKGTNSAHNSQPSSQNETNIDFYKAFDPYTTDPTKTFTSPLSITSKKWLSEENYFVEENLILGLKTLFDSISDSVKVYHQRKVDESHIQDNERREEQWSELDTRLKSLAPRKGKLEVEEYDKRWSEIEKHEEKLEKHKNMIISKNEKDKEDNTAWLNKISNEFENLKNEFDLLSKGIDEEETKKGLEDKYKKFKTMYYDFLSQLGENEGLLEQFSKDNPNNLLQSNKNYILSLQSIKKGGTYSDREIEFTKGELDKIDNETIKVEMEERSKVNAEKVAEVKSASSGWWDEIEKKYLVTNENIMALNGIGKKFGAPKRWANDIIINIKIKFNQAKEGWDLMLKELHTIISDFNSIKDINSWNDALLKDSLPIDVRKQLSKINSCVFNYGKYIDAFKPSILTGYTLKRVIMKENVESCEIVNKEDIEYDEQLKNEELMALGFLGKIILEGNPQQTQNTKGAKGGANTNEPNFNVEINSIEEKLKVECAKIYTGNFAKYLDPTTKLAHCLIPFLQGIKTDMELMRLRCVRELRTFSQNLYTFSWDIPKCVMKFIFSNACWITKNKNDEIVNNYNNEQQKSEKIKNKWNTILGPYLANPHYIEDLTKISKEDDERNVTYITQLNKTQFNVIENEEINSQKFMTRLINNFDSWLNLFDNFIFEEEYISWGDEEYFKKRQTYNELLKLKEGIAEMSNVAGGQGNKNVKAQNLDASNYNLDSKRTFKKIYKGINLKTGKINYYEWFTSTVSKIVENSEDKIKVLETEYKKDNYTKNITGIKLQNNKNWYIERNAYYVSHCESFNASVQEGINKYNKDRWDELEYKAKWNNMLKGLEQTLENAGGTIESKEEQKGNDEKPQIGSKQKRNDSAANKQSKVNTVSSKK